MSAFLRPNTSRSILPARLLVMPKDLYGDLLKQRADLSQLFADFDEQSTSSVRGPYLIEAMEVEAQTARLLRDAGADEAMGYKILISDESRVPDSITGDYCAYYRKQKVLTQDLETARRISEILISQDVLQDFFQVDPQPGESLPDRLANRYIEALPAGEVRIAFPFLLLFFLISAASTISAVRFGADPAAGSSLFWWSLVPLIFYGALLALVFSRPAVPTDFFSLRNVSEMTSSEIRKSKYTQIILTVLILFASFGTFDAFFWWLQRNDWAADGARLALSGLAVLLLLALILFTHRRLPGVFTRTLLVAFVMVAFAFIDSADQTIQGRTLVFQIIPILLAGFLITPGASLAAGGTAILLLTARANSAGLGVNSTAYLGLAVIAFLNWLISRGLENALAEIEAANRELEKKVAQRTRQLAKANQFKSEFLSQVSHELQSPIIAFSLFLKKITPLVNSEEHLALENETRRVLEMSKAISSVAKIELDLLEQNQRIQRIDLVPGVRKVLQVATYQAQEAGVSLIFEPAVNSLPVIGNPDHIPRILHNVISNAIKYSSSGGKVTIHADRIGTDGLLEIADTGIGIPPDELPFIFDRFTRASNAGGRPGTGLGLSMVRDMMEAMDGEIGIHSAPGRGTTVSLRFPLA